MSANMTRSTTISGVKDDVASAVRMGWSGALLVAAFVFCYAEVFTIMAKQWSGSDSYSYGFLIPLISVYLIWTRLGQLGEIQPNPDYWSGALVMAAGFAMLILGHVGTIIVLQELSLIVALCGSVLVLFGKRFLRALAMPIAYLLFMIPFIWDWLTAGLHFPLQLFSAWLGGNLLNALGVPVYREGAYLHLPNITLEVARVCSGVSYLIAVGALSIPLASLYLKSWRRRIALVAFAVIVAILSNGVRVTLIGIFSYYNLSEDVHGPLHVFQGLFVSVIGYVAIFAGLGVLSRGTRKEQSRAIRSVTPIASSGVVGHVYGYKSLILALTFLVVGTLRYAYAVSAVPPALDLAQFPQEVGGWVGNAGNPDPILSELEADQSLSRVYRREDGKEVDLYIRYLELQDDGRKLISYKTENLYRDSSKVQVGDLSQGGFEVNRVVIREQGRERLLYFWSDLNGHMVADRYYAKVYTILDALRARRTNGAMIVVGMDIHAGQSVSAADQDSAEFILAITPLLRRHFP